MKKSLLILAAILTISATSAQAYGPHGGYYGGRRPVYVPPRKQVVVVKQPVHRPHYTTTHYYTASHHSHGSRDAARVGAVILGVGALVLATQAF